MLALNAKDYFEARSELRAAFLADNIGGDFDIKLVASDWASRRYFRIRRPNGGTQILMEAIPDHTGQYTPGHKLSDYIRISYALREAGIRAPQIAVSDEHEGYLLLEDFGDLSVYAALEQGEDADVLYGEATNILIRMRDNLKNNNLNLPDYYAGHVHKGRQRIVDWYIPATRSAKNADGLLESYLAAWTAVEKHLPPCPMGFSHGDYHAQNLMRLDDALGVLDFQGAMWGPLPYDLANLLEDIRRDVPPDIRAAMIGRYDVGETFSLWYRVMATQFHCRILGQTLRLAIAGGRPDFLKFIPRVQNYIREALDAPVLKPLAQWFQEEKVDLEAENCFDPGRVKEFIRHDAF
ncbi:MAG TPA: phosphotransferase [Micavibrio sp.]|nr:phosphotransferase [Micavibrio sp.]